MKDIVASYMYLVESFENFLLLSISMKCRKEEYYSKFISIYFFFFFSSMADTAKKLSFSLRVFSVNVIKSAEKCRFGQIYRGNP